MARSWVYLEFWVFTFLRDSSWRSAPESHKYDICCLVLVVFHLWDFHLGLVRILHVRSNGGQGRTALKSDRHNEMHHLWNVLTECEISPFLSPAPVSHGRASFRVPPGPWPVPDLGIRQPFFGRVSLPFLGRIFATPEGGTTERAWLRQPSWIHPWRPWRLPDSLPVFLELVWPVPGFLPGPAADSFEWLPVARNDK